MIHDRAQGLSLSLQEWDLLVSANQFQENTYDALNAQVGGPFEVLGEAYFELRGKIELYLESVLAETEHSASANLSPQPPEPIFLRTRTTSSE